MNKEKILNDIKALLSFNTVDFLDSKLSDGTTIVRVEAENFEVGLPFFLVSEEGPMPAPAGEYYLEDNRVIIVDEGGIITEVKEAAEEAENTEAAPEAAAPVELSTEEFVEALEEVKNEDAPAEEEEGVDKMAAMEEKMSKLEKDMEELQETIKEIMSNNNTSEEFSKVIIEKINDFIENAPADLNFKAIEEIKTNNFSTHKSNIKAKQVDSIESIKNIRKK